MLFDCFGHGHFLQKSGNLAAQPCKLHQLSKETGLGSQAVVGVVVVAVTVVVSTAVTVAAVVVALVAVVDYPLCCSYCS